MNATPNAPSLGTYRDRSIPAFIDGRGGRYFFEGIAVEDGDGSIALSQLRYDELLISPGLIYRKETR